MLNTDIPLAILKDIEKNKNLPLFRFKKFDEKQYLLTNEVGEFTFLKTNDFHKYLQDKLTKNDEIYQELETKSFIKTEKYTDILAEKYNQKYAYLKWPTGLHIMVLTLKCNHKCLYCHASAGAEDDSSLDMTEDTAKKTVDLIFSSPSNNLAIEFQGGEPTLNWSVLKSTVEYINQKSLESPQKKIEIRLVTNFSTMNREKAQFILKNKIQLCTSLDGPEEIHNHNRIWTDGNSYKEAIKWIEYFKQKVQERKEANKLVRGIFPTPMPTITKKTLQSPKELIDSYIAIGTKIIMLRPINKIGFGKKTWEEIGYTTEEFMTFYEKALNYILELNLKGIHFHEGTAAIKLKRIFDPVDPGYVDDCSPCGAGIGQIAYNYDGNIYTCDEGRMIANTGEELFQMGNVYENDWESLIDSDACKSCATISCNETYPGLANHVYKPYIGICPVHNYSDTGNTQANFFTTEAFKRQELLLDLIFHKMQNEKTFQIFKNWAEF